LHPILKARKEGGEERKKEERLSKTIIQEIANKREISGF
jgi:hypothetical protein